MRTQKKANLQEQYGWRTWAQDQNIATRQILSAPYWVSESDIA